MKFISLMSGLVVSNFLYQGVTGRQWKVATERSFFQAVAVLLAWGID